MKNLKAYLFSVFLFSLCSKSFGTQSLSCLTYYETSLLKQLHQLIQKQSTSSKTYLLSQVLDKHQQQTESFYKDFLEDYKIFENSSSLKESIAAVESLVPVISEKTLKLHSLSSETSNKNQQQLRENINILKITYDGLIFKRNSLIHSIEESHLFFRKYEATERNINKFKNSLENFTDILRDTNSSTALDPSLVTLALDTVKVKKEIIEQQISFLHKLKKQHNEYLNKAIVMNSVTIPKLEQILIEVDNEHPEFNLGFFEAYFTNKQRKKKLEASTKTNSEVNEFIQTLKGFSEVDGDLSIIQNKFQKIFFINQPEIENNSIIPPRISLEQAFSILSLISNKASLVPETFKYLVTWEQGLKFNLRLRLPELTKKEQNQRTFFYKFPQKGYEAPKPVVFNYNYQHLYLNDINIFLENAFTLMMLTQKAYSYGHSPVVDEFFNFIAASLQSFKHKTEEQIKTEIEKNKLKHLYTTAIDPATNLVLALKTRVLAINHVIDQLPAVKEAHLNAVINSFALKRDAYVYFERNQPQYLILDPDDTF